MDWVCDDAWIGPFTQAMFYVGAALGAIIFGYVSDIYGRYPTFVASNMVRTSWFCSNYAERMRQPMQKNKSVSKVVAAYRYFWPLVLRCPIAPRYIASH